MYDGVYELTGLNDVTRMSHEDALLPGWWAVQQGEDHDFLCLTASTAAYQDCPKNRVVNRFGKERRLHVAEEERLMGLPDNWTLPAAWDRDETSAEVKRVRRKLLGNAWHLAVATFIQPPHQRAIIGRHDQ